MRAHSRLCFGPVSPLSPDRPTNPQWVVRGRGRDLRINYQRVVKGQERDLQIKCSWVPGIAAPLSCPREAGRRNQTWLTGHLPFPRRDLSYWRPPCCIRRFKSHCRLLNRAADSDRASSLERMQEQARRWRLCVTDELPLWPSASVPYSGINLRPLGSPLAASGSGR